MQMRETLRAWLWPYGGVVALFVVILGLLLWWLGSQPTLLSFSSDDARTQLKYDVKLRKTPLSEQDKNDKIVLRLVEPANEPELLVTLRYEDGLKPLATAAKQDLRDTLADTVAKTYPQRFPEFHQVSSRSYALNSHKAYETVFAYKSPAKKLIKQRFIIVVVSDDKAVYLAMQSKESDFDSLNKTYFNPIARSLQVN